MFLMFLSQIFPRYTYFWLCIVDMGVHIFILSSWGHAWLVKTPNRHTLKQFLLQEITDMLKVKSDQRLWVQIDAITSFICQACHWGDLLARGIWWWSSSLLKSCSRSASNGAVMLTMTVRSHLQLPSEPWMHSVHPLLQWPVESAKRCIKSVSLKKGYFKRSTFYETIRVQVYELLGIHSVLP